MTDTNRLRGKVALITGSGQRTGISEAIAQRLAAEGCAVMLHVQETVLEPPGPSAKANIESVTSQIRDGGGGQIATCVGDVLNEKGVQYLVQSTVSAFGRLDFLINNTQCTELSGQMVEMSAESWDAVFGGNLRAAFLTMKHAARQMLAQNQGGVIVTITRQANKSGLATTTAYTASNHALIGLTRAAALELGPHHIRVNAICPNLVSPRHGALQNESMAQARGRCANEPIAAACAFLCSDQAASITGAVLDVSCEGPALG